MPEATGRFSGIKKVGKALGNVFFTSNAVTKKDKYATNPDTGKITVHVSEMDFIASNYSKLLIMERNFDVEEGENEAILEDAMINVIAVLRSNPIQRRLVRKQLFFDADVETGQPDSRILAGNIKDYFKLCIGPTACPSKVFLELTIELLAIFLLGSTTENTTNEPRVLESVEPKIGSRNEAKRKAARNDNNPAGTTECEANQESFGSPFEVAYCLKLGLVEILDTLIADTTCLGLDPYLLGNCSQSLCWAVALYRFMVETDETVAKHAYDKRLIKTAWEIVSHKTKIRDPQANRIAGLKISALYLLKELGRGTVDQLESPESINIINLNPRSIKELTKLLHHYPAMHPAILVVMTMVAQKEANNLMLKEQGMMEYLTTKVLPFFSDAHHKSIPHLVILLNSWIVSFEDLQFFYQFNGIQCLVYHMKTAVQAENQSSTDAADGANWEDMVLHGLSVLYKLSDSRQYHSKMVTDDCLTVLLEGLRVVDPLKSVYHMNGFIAALYSLRNLTAGSLLQRGTVAQHEQFFLLSHLLSVPSLPINCLIHLLFLFSILSKDHVTGQPADASYRDIVMNTVFPASFKPLCKLVQASPLRKVLDDSQLTVICLALQILITLISIAKQENPLLCIQIEHDLPLQTLKVMAKADSKTPYPNLANEVLGMVYLMP